MTNWRPGLAGVFGVAGSRQSIDPTACDDSEIGGGTEASTEAAGQSAVPSGDTPQDGVIWIAETRLPFGSLGKVLVFWITRSAGRPFCPTLTAAGNTGVTPSPTPAHAAAAASISE